MAKREPSKSFTAFAITLATRTMIFPSESPTTSLRPRSSRQAAVMSAPSHTRRPSYERSMRPVTPSQMRTLSAVTVMNLTMAGEYRHAARLHSCRACSVARVTEGRQWSVKAESEAVLTGGLWAVEALNAALECGCRTEPAVECHMSLLTAASLRCMSAASGQHSSGALLRQRHPS